MVMRRWAVDIEGSGKNPAEIVELAVVELSGLSLTGLRKHWLFKPRNGISPIVSRIHGIWDDDVALAPDIDDVADDILELMGDDPIIGHNVRVEVDLLGTVLPDWKPAGAIDTLKMAKAYLPTQPKHGLEALGTELGLAIAASDLVEGQAHSAPFDAIVTALLFERLLAPLSETERDRAILDADILHARQASLL